MQEFTDIEYEETFYNLIEKRKRVWSTYPLISRRKKFFHTYLIEDGNMKKYMML